MRSLAILLLIVFIALGAGADTEIIQDNGFRRGFVLWEPRPGKHVKYGQVFGVETNAKPVWGLSQWSSKFPLSPEAIKGVGGSIILSNAAKAVILQPMGSAVSFSVNSGVEYGQVARGGSDAWVHLLAEQEFANPPFLNTISSARFHLEARLLYSTNLHRGDYDPGTHAAQFQVFFTLQNRNPKSKDYGDFLWFGIPVYDNRYPHPPAFKSKDFGGTGKFIFTPDARTFTPSSAHSGDWLAIDRDLLPLLHDSLVMAWTKGFLSGSSNISDYAISGMNMGWELPGTFDVTLETRNLSLKVSTNERNPLKTLPIAGETFTVAGSAAFVISAPKSANGKPWVWYAPTLPAYPAQEEKWMFQQFTNAGISIAGLDVGESYGSPRGSGRFNLLYEHMLNRGYSAKPILLGRSRGGLMLLSWAADNPEKVGGFAGIYPVCNLASYPGIAKAAPAYDLTAAQLQNELSKYNPIERLEPMAKADVPFFAIHGDIDTVVPLEANSGLVYKRYTTLGGKMELIVPPGQGHNMWTGFFQSQELVNFVIQHAK